ncbi:MAG: hypothetical protein ACRC6E_11140 [Fusobacteriaceae bacterium]
MKIYDKKLNVTKIDKVGLLEEKGSFNRKNLIKVLEENDRNLDAVINWIVEQGLTVEYDQAITSYDGYNYSVSCGITKLAVIYFK